MTEAIRERGGPTLQFSEDPFDSIPISVATHLKSESSSLQCSLEVLSAINEEDCGFDIVFFSQFAKEDLRKRCRGRGKQPDMQQVVSLGVCGGVQPELLVVDPNHRLVERDLIRRLAGFGL